MHCLLVSGCSEARSRRWMKANSSKSTYIILWKKKKLFFEKMFYWRVSSWDLQQTSGLYRPYLNVVEAVQGDLLSHRCLYKVIYNASESTTAALDFSNAVFMMCVHSLMVEIRGVGPITSVDVNPNQHTAAGLKAGLEGSRLNLDPGWRNHGKYWLVERCGIFLVNSHKVLVIKCHFQALRAQQEPWLSFKSKVHEFVWSHG